jgi:hypothetical protein
MDDERAFDICLLSLGSEGAASAAHFFLRLQRALCVGTLDDELEHKLCPALLGRDYASLASRTQAQVAEDDGERGLFEEGEEDRGRKLRLAVHLALHDSLGPASPVAPAKCAVNERARACLLTGYSRFLLKTRRWGGWRLAAGG